MYRMPHTTNNTCKYYKTKKTIKLLNFSENIILKRLRMLNSSGEGLSLPCIYHPMRSGLKLWVKQKQEGRGKRLSGLLYLYFKTMFANDIVTRKAMESRTSTSSLSLSPLTHSQTRSQQIESRSPSSPGCCWCWRSTSPVWRTWTWCLSPSAGGSSRAGPGYRAGGPRPHWR